MDIFHVFFAGRLVRSKMAGLIVACFAQPPWLPIPQRVHLAGRIRKLKDKLGENLEFRLAFDGELPGSEGGVVVLEKHLCRKMLKVS